VENAFNQIARIDHVTGKFDEYPLSVKDAVARKLGADWDGNLWVGLHGAGKLLRVDYKTLEMKEFAPPSEDAGVYLAEPDLKNHLIWTTLHHVDKLGRLDPATGTATFLYRVLDFIREQFERKRNLGAWGDYVHEHLLPRLFGFELLMAPYAVAHFKLGLALAAWDKEPLFRPQWSYEPAKDERINIFLTNTLEDLEKTAEQLGPLRVLSDEANSAYEIKKHKPVLVVFGNPPYSGHPANTGEWITMLVRDYYLCDGQPLGERNAHWLLDDYVKFIRWGQWRIEQTERYFSQVEEAMLGRCSTHCSDCKCRSSQIGSTDAAGRHNRT
jgi:hypothetical protein